MRGIKILTVGLLVFCLVSPEAWAGAGMSQAAASLIMPTTGQAMNGQLGNTKTKVMAGLEAGLITTTAILGGVVGGGIVWAGVGPLIANHLWSSMDAYQNATPEMTAQQSQLEEAQRILRESQERNKNRHQHSSFYDEPVLY